MIPVVNVIDSNLGLPVASAFCLTNNNLVEAGVYFKHMYPEMMFQDLPSGWYFTDYLTLDNKALCSMLTYETVYVDNDSLEESAECAINDLIRYLKTRDKNGLRAVLTLLES